MRRLSLHVAAFCVLLGLLLSGCASGGGVPSSFWSNYPYLFPKATPKPWLMLLCQFSDVSTQPVSTETARKFLTQDGQHTGGLYDYFHDVSYNAISLDGSDVKGPFVAPYSLAAEAAAGTAYNGSGRYEHVRKCAEKAAQQDTSIHFSDYYGVIGLLNYNVTYDKSGNPTGGEAGACGIGQTDMQINGAHYMLACVQLDSASLKIEFAGQEVAHGFGLQHSYDDLGSSCGGNPGEYCDPWDIMSAQGTFKFRGFAFGPNGPGLNGPNLLTVGWIPQDRQQNFTLGDPETEVTLAALSHPEASGKLVVGISGTPDDYFTVEYREKDGWDAGIPENAVLVHHVVHGRSILVHQPGAGTLPDHLGQGDQWIMPGFSGGVFVRRIDPKSHTATITLSTGNSVSRLPYIKIVTPPSGSHVTVGNQVQFAADVNDYSGHAVSDSAVTWKADGKLLGQGANLLASLPLAGTYTISATVAANGQTSSDSVVLTVDPAASPPATPLVRIISPTENATFTLQGLGGHATIILASDVSAGVTQYHWTDKLHWIDDTHANDTLTLTLTPQQLPCNSSVADVLTLTAQGASGPPASAPVDVSFYRACIS
jgi:M6 family metalloprotease-like protein